MFEHVVVVVVVSRQRKTGGKVHPMTMGSVSFLESSIRKSDLMLDVGFDALILDI